MAGVALLLGESPQCFFHSFKEYSKRNKNSFRLFFTNTAHPNLELIGIIIAVFEFRRDDVNEINFCPSWASEWLGDFLDRTKDRQGLAAKISQGDKQQ